MNKSKNDKPVLFYEKKGSGKNTIILIHGFGLNRKSWYDIAPALAKESMIYMVDLVGFGDSPAPETWPYTIEAQAETIFDFIRDKNLSDIVLIGHSYGGGVALRLLYKMIENGNGDLVKRMVLIAPAAYPQPLPFFIAIPCIPYIGGLLLKWISAEFQIKMTLNKVFHNKTAVTRERINRYKNNLENRDYQRALIKMAQNVIPKDASTIIEEIKKIEHRVLLIYGDNDSVILIKNLERLSTCLPNAETKILSDCGHIPHEEYPAHVAGLISRFLLEDNA